MASGASVQGGGADQTCGVPKKALPEPRIDRWLRDLLAAPVAITAGVAPADCLGDHLPDQARSIPPWQRSTEATLTDKINGHPLMAPLCVKRQSGVVV